MLVCTDALVERMDPCRAGRAAGASDLRAQVQQHGHPAAGKPGHTGGGASRL